MNRKKSEKYFWEEYQEICQKLNTAYALGFKQRIINDGYSYLLISKHGSIENILCKYTKDIFSNYINDIIKLIDNISDEFETSLTEKFINDFRIINEKNIDSHIEAIEIQIKSIIERELSENTKISLNSIKENAKLDSIKELSKKNESVKRKIKKAKKKDGFFANLKRKTLESFIGWLIPFLLGCLIGNVDRIIDFFRNILNK